MQRKVKNTLLLLLYLNYANIRYIFINNIFFLFLTEEQEGILAYYR